MRETVSPKYFSDQGQRYSLQGWLCFLGSLRGMHSPAPTVRRALRHCFFDQKGPRRLEKGA